MLLYKCCLHNKAARRDFDTEDLIRYEVVRSYDQAGGICSTLVANFKSTSVHVPILPYNPGFHII
jgi:hypothetical protein